MHGNMVFSRDSISPTPQQSGCLLVCSVITRSRDDYGNITSSASWRTRVFFPVSIACECYNELITR